MKIIVWTITSAFIVLGCAKDSQHGTTCTPGTRDCTCDYGACWDGLECDDYNICVPATGEDEEDTNDDEDPSGTDDEGNTDDGEDDATDSVDDTNDDTSNDSATNETENDEASDDANESDDNESDDESSDEDESDDESNDESDEDESEDTEEDNSSDDTPTDTAVATDTGIMTDTDPNPDCPAECVVGCLIQGGDYVEGTCTGERERCCDFSALETEPGTDIDTGSDDGSDPTDEPESDTGGDTTDDPTDDTSNNNQEDNNFVAEVENEGSSCELSGDIPGPVNNTMLPDPFMKLDGTRMSSKSEWRCRRQEILRVAMEHVYGWKPEKPESVTGTVTNTSITVNVSHEGNQTSFSVDVEMPNTASAPPYPAMIGLKQSFFGIGTDEGVIKDEGVAMISYDPFVVGDEGGSRSNKTGAFYDIYGSDSYSGLLVAWAWGVSRIIDVIQESDGSVLKWDAIGVTGCSRFGKGAFAIGVFDQRIALTMPVESGSGGVPIWRGIVQNGGQSPDSAYGETYWLGDAFGNFISNVNELPMDTHEMVATIAPRGILVFDNAHIDHLGARSGHDSVLAAAEVYNALGYGDNISYHSDVQEGEHCGMWANKAGSWETVLRDNIRKHLQKQNVEAGVIAAWSAQSGNLQQWRDWTTPNLQ